MEYLARWRFVFAIWCMLSVFSVSEVFAQDFVPVPPHRPEKNPSAWDVPPDKLGDPKRRGQFTGALAFELIKKSVGSGRFFGQAVRLPYAQVDIVDASGEKLNPCMIITDAEGIFSFNLYDPSISGTHDCGLPRMPSIEDSIRLLGHSRRDRDDFGIKFTHGYTFSPFELSCQDGDGLDCYHPDDRQQLFDNRLNESLDCLRRVNYGDYEIFNRTGCQDGKDKFDVDVDSLLGEFIFQRGLISIALREWQNTDSLAEKLGVQLERKIAATNETVELSKRALSFHNNLMRAELDETRLAFDSAKRCASRCRSFELFYCVPKCMLGFLASEIESKIKFLEKSVLTLGAVVLAWNNVGLQWIHYVVIMAPATFALWAIGEIGEDSDYVQKFVEMGYVVLSAQEQVLVMTGQAAQLAVQIATDFHSVTNAFEIVRLMKEFQDFLIRADPSNGDVVDGLEVVESIFVSNQAFTALKALVGSLNIAIGGRLFPRRVRHQVDLPIDSINGTKIHVKTMSPAFSDLNIPLSDDLPNTLGWIIANWSYRVERARDVLYEKGEDGLSIYETKERKDSLGLEVVWPAIGCKGVSCYIGMDFDSIGMPPPLRTGHEIYLTSNNGFDSLTRRLPKAGVNRNTIVHEFGHYVHHVITGLDRVALDTSFSIVDLGKSHQVCDKDGLSSHAGFGEGFANFVVFLSEGVSNTSEYYNPLTSEVDYINIKGNPIGGKTIAGVKYLPWAGNPTPSVDTDGDGIPDVEEVTYNLLNGSNSDFDADGLSDGFEYHIGTPPKDPSVKLPVLGKGYAYHDQPAFLKGVHLKPVPQNPALMNSDDYLYGSSICADEGPHEEARVASVLFNFMDERQTPEHVVNSWRRHPCRSALNNYDCAKGHVCQAVEMVSMGDGVPLSLASDFVFRSFPDQVGVNSEPIGRGPTALISTLADGLCVPRTNQSSCTSDSFTCSVGEVCEGQSCVDACVTNLDCPGSHECVSSRCQRVEDCVARPSVCHSGYTCLDSVCKRPVMSVEYIMRAAAESNLLLYLSTLAAPDNICEMREPLVDAIGNHGMDCDYSDETCALKTQFVIDNIFAYHTINVDNCGNFLKNDDYYDNYNIHSKDADAYTYVSTYSEALSSPYAGHDRDRDAKLDAEDGCPFDYDPDAPSWDLTACDADGDFIINTEDNCPADWNPKQLDCNHNGIGAACEPADPLHECSDIQIVGGQGVSFLDIKMYTGSSEQTTSPENVNWEVLNLDPSYNASIWTNFTTLYENNGEIALPCLDDYRESEVSLLPTFDVMAPDLIYKDIGHGNGYQQTQQLGLAVDANDRYVQVRASWTDPTTGADLRRCSKPIRASWFYNYHNEHEVRQLGVGSLIELPMHFYFIEDSISGDAPKLYFGHPGRHKLQSVNADLSLLGVRTGMVGRFIPSKSRVDRLYGHVYLYGGRRPDGTRLRDIWRLPIDDWRYPGTLELVRDDSNESPNQGLGSGADGWSFDVPEHAVMIVGGIGESASPHISVLGLADQSSARLPIAPQFDMRNLYVMSAPAETIGTSQHREPACIENMLATAAYDCPVIQLDVDDCLDAADNPCTEDSPSYVDYTFQVDWSNMACQLVLASCPASEMSIVIANPSQGIKTFGQANHTAPSVLQGQASAVVPEKREVLLFGGVQAGSTKGSNLLHRFSIRGGHFVEVQASNKPPARSWASLVWNDVTQTLYMLGGESSGALRTDLWSIQPFVEHPVWTQIETDSSFAQDTLVKASLIWDRDRDTYMLIGGAQSINPTSGQASFSAVGKMSTKRFQISNGQVILECQNEECE